MAVVHCKRAPYDVYVGRGRDLETGAPGEWGNPFSHRPSRVPGVIVVASVEEAIERFRVHLWAEVRCGRLSLERLAALDGKVLGCWCAPGPCHGEVLAAASWAAAQLRLGEFPRA